MTDAQLGIASLAVVVAGIVFWMRAVQNVAIPENRVAYVVAAIAALASGLAALFGAPGWLGGFAATIGVVISTFFLFTVAIGGQRVGQDAITVGASLPHFTATDEHGEHFDSASLEGHPVLIKFFRGHW